MPNIKNNEIAPYLLQRLFIYHGDDDPEQEQAHVRAFCEWLPTLMHPVTKKPFEKIADITMYRYIRGEQIPSWDILYAVSHYFHDPVLYNMFNMAPWPGDEERFQARLDEAKSDAKKAMQRVRELESVLRKRKR